MKYMKLSRLLLIIGVLLFSAYLYYPIGNNKSLGDINETIEFINVIEVKANGNEIIPEEKTVPTPITGAFNILTYIAGIILFLLSTFLITYAMRKKKEVNY